MLGTSLQPRLAERIEAFFGRSAGEHITMEDWLTKIFPKGMEQLIDQIDRESGSTRQALARVMDRPAHAWESFGAPSFDQEYSVVHAVCSQDGYGTRRELIDAVQLSKETYEDACRARIFFTQEFFPRLQELRKGSTVSQHDAQLFQQAIEFAIPLSRQYDREVVEELKPASGSYGAFRLFLDTVLRQMKMAGLKVVPHAQLNQGATILEWSR